MEDSSVTDPTLPTELITEILSRLPVKTLVRFRSVSKSWVALVSSPEFVKTHLSVSANNKDYTHHRLVLTAGRNMFTSREIDYFLRDCSHSSLLNDSVTEAFRLNYPMNKPHKSVTAVGSVNGLICLAIDDSDLFLWNPSVRRYKNLPDRRPTVSRGYHFGWFKYGFGYDESNDDYKVVGIFRNHDNERLHQVKIYSLKSNSWRSKSDIPNGMRFTGTGKFVNGKLHWAGELHWPNNWAFHKNWNIISIDLADEKWGKVEQPRDVEVDFCLELVVLGSDLSLICKYPVSQANVWVMREYGVKESWTKLYTVKYPSYVCSFIDRTLCMSNKGEILLVPGSTLKVHNPKDELIRYPKIVNLHSCVAADIYVESLVVPYYRTNRAHNQN